MYLTSNIDIINLIRNNDLINITSTINITQLV